MEGFLFLEAHGRFDCLIKMFAYYPEKSISHVFRKEHFKNKKKGTDPKPYNRFLVTDTALFKF